MFHVLISLFMVALSWYLEMPAQAREHDSSLQAGPNQGHNWLPKMLEEMTMDPRGRNERNLKGKTFFI